MRPLKMAPAGTLVCGLWVPLAVLALLARAALALTLTERYPALSLFQQERHQQRHGPAGDWAEQYSAECGSSFLHFHESDCDIGGSSSCESILSLNTEKILSQAKLLAEQKRFPFATDNDSTNEELAIAYVLIGNGLYDEAIRHFSTMLQEEPELVSAIYGRGIAYGKKGLHSLSLSKETAMVCQQYRGEGGERGGPKATKCPAPRWELEIWAESQPGSRDF